MKYLISIILLLFLVSPAYSGSMDSLTPLTEAPDQGDRLLIDDDGTSKSITSYYLMKLLEGALTSFEIHADNLPSSIVGNVDADGTPALYEFATWVDENTIGGVAVAADSVVCTDANGEPEVCTNLTDVDYQLLEDQDLSTTDSPTFDDITLTCADGENCGTELDSMPDYDEQCVGDLITVTAGQDNIIHGMVLTIQNSTGKWIAANANSTGVLPARGIACIPPLDIDADTDESFTVMLRGFIRDESWDFTGDINKDMLLDDEAGAMVLADGTIPADTGDIIQIIGYVTMTSTQETFYFNPQPVYSVLN